MITVPIFDVPLHCINEAAIEYHVPAKLIISVLETERGKVGEIVKNKNGSYDIGLMQINSTWIPYLAKHGVTEESIRYDGCTNVKVGAWILGKKIAGENDLLVGVGDYNSHTEHFNRRYANRVRMNFTRLNLMLG